MFSLLIKLDNLAETTLKHMNLINYLLEQSIITKLIQQ